jgi:hypothetical protein
LYAEHLEQPKEIAKKAAQKARRIVAAQILARQALDTSHRDRDTDDADNAPRVWPVDPKEREARREELKKKKRASEESTEDALDAFLAKMSEGTPSASTTSSPPTLDEFIDWELRTRLSTVGAELIRIAGSSENAVENLPHVERIVRSLISREIKECYFYTTMGIQTSA